LAPAVVVAVVAELPVPLLQQPEVAAARPVLLLQFPARLLREAQLLRPVPLPRQPEVAAVRPAALPQEAEVAVAVVLVQGLVASEILRSR
jgi:hypothetical protein